MPTKASLFRLEEDTQVALANMSKLLGRPMNKLVNEAVSQYLRQKTSQEREIETTLQSLRTYRRNKLGQRHATAPPTPTNPGPDSKTLRATHEFIRRVREHYPVRTAILFGSRARGTHRSDSDADVAMVLNGERGNFMNTVLEMADIAFDVLLETGINIQPVPIWEDEWKRPETHSNPTLLKNIEREGVVL